MIYPFRELYFQKVGTATEVSYLDQLSIVGSENLSASNMTFCPFLKILAFLYLLLMPPYCLFLPVGIDFNFVPTYFFWLFCPFSFIFSPFLFSFFLPSPSGSSRYILPKGVYYLCIGTSLNQTDHYKSCCRCPWRRCTSESRARTKQVC